MTITEITPRWKRTDKFSLFFRNKQFLRYSAVRKLYDRGLVGRDYAVSKLTEKADLYGKKCDRKTAIAITEMWDRALNQRAA